MHRHRRCRRVERLHGPGVVGDRSLESGPEAGARGVIDPTAPAASGRCGDDGLHGLGVLAGIAVRGDPGRDRAIVAEEMEREAHVAFARIVVQLQTTASAGQVIELAGFLRLADEALRHGLPCGPDAVRPLGIAPDGRAARSVARGQWAPAAGARSRRWLPQMGQTRVPFASGAM